MYAFVISKEIPVSCRKCLTMVASLALDEGETEDTEKTCGSIAPGVVVCGKFHDQTVMPLVDREASLLTANPAVLVTNDSIGCDWN